MLSSEISGNNDLSALTAPSGIEARQAKPTHVEKVEETEAGPLKIAPATVMTLRGEAAQLRMYPNNGHPIVRADHSVRDCLEGVTKNLGDFIRSAATPTAGFGFSQRSTPDVEVGTLRKAVTAATQLFEEHATARGAGDAPSLVVRNVASEALALLEHLGLTMATDYPEDRLPGGDRAPLLHSIVDVRHELRKLVQHFDGAMLEIIATNFSEPQEPPSPRLAG